MCRLACDENSSWLMVDDWEASQPEYQRTAVVLEHFDREINETYGGVEDEDGASPFPWLSGTRSYELTKQMFISNPIVRSSRLRPCGQVSSTVCEYFCSPAQTLYKPCLNLVYGHYAM